jgi:hypothetical protein
VENAVLCGMDGKARVSPAAISGVNYSMNCWAVWAKPDTLEIHLRPLESINDRILFFRFRGNKIRMKPSSVSSLVECLKAMIDIFIGPFLPAPAIAKPIMRLFSPAITVILEPALSGKEKRL